MLMHGAPCSPPRWGDGCNGPVGLFADSLYLLLSSELIRLRNGQSHFPLGGGLMEEPSCRPALLSPLSLPSLPGSGSAGAGREGVRVLLSSIHHGRAGREGEHRLA